MSFTYTLTSILPFATPVCRLFRLGLWQLGANTLPQVLGIAAGSAWHPGISSSTMGTEQPFPKQSLAAVLIGLNIP